LSLATFGAGAFVLRGAATTAKSIAAGRVAGLIDDGCSVTLASSWVASSWSKAAPGIGSRYLLQGMGDPGVGQLLRFLRPTGPGAAVDDPALVGSVLRELRLVRALSASDPLVALSRRFADPLRLGVERRQGAMS